MRKLDGEQVLMRIFVGESDRWEHRPLHAALLELFRTRGLAGATVLRAVAGFGANSVVHTANILRLSADLPSSSRSWIRRSDWRPCCRRSTE
jgi:PII-like signaling protein